MKVHEAENFLLAMAEGHEFQGRIGFGREIREALEAFTGQIRELKAVAKEYAPAFTKHGRDCCGRPYPQEQCSDCPMVEYLKAKEKAA
jgi:hypothetical protein